MNVTQSNTDGEDFRMNRSVIMFEDGDLVVKIQLTDKETEDKEVLRDYLTQRIDRFRRDLEKIL